MASYVKVTPELSKEVVSLKASGQSLSVISREVNRSKSVISRILKLYDKNKTFCLRPKLVDHELPQNEKIEPWNALLKRSF